MKSLIFIIVCAVATIVLSLTPSWADKEWHLDPNLVSDGFSISDSNFLITSLIIWEQPVYDCPKHGETTNVMIIYTGSGSECNAVCIKCFFDVFPPLKKIK